MARLTNTIKLHDEYVEVICETINYKHSVLLDNPSDIVGKIRVSNSGYAIFSGTKIKDHFVAHSVMSHLSNRKTVVDHKSGNTLDNRRENLRIITQHQNSQHKTRFVRNNTGTIGIAYRKNGKYEYYRVSLTDRSKGINTNRQGKRLTKQFNINKMGREAAFVAANLYLKEKKKEFCYVS